MKFAIQIGEPPRADARPAGREKATADRADRDDAFDSVLAKIHGETTPPTTATTAPTLEKSTAPDAARSDPKASDRDAREPNINGRDPSWSVGLASFAESSDGSAVGTLLKRIKSKEESAGTDALAQNTPPGIDQTAVAVPLLSSPQAIAMPPETNQSPKAPETQAAPLPKDADIEGASAPSATKVVLDVSVSAHVAPAIGTRGSAQPVDEPPAAAPGEQEAEAPQSQSKVFLGPAVSPPTANANRPEARGTVEAGEIDRAGKSAQASPASVAAGGAGTSSRENAPRDRGTDFLASKPVEDVSYSSPTTVIVAQAPGKLIAAAVVELAGRASTGNGAIETVATTQIAPARTVTLRMSPAHLGTVEVRLHLTGHGLDLQLTISERETLGLVTRERDALTSALRGQNYEIHSLVIQDGSTSAPSGGTHVAKHDSSSDRSADQHGRESPGGGTGDGRNSQDPGRQARSFRPRDEDSPRARVADGRSLFI